TAGARRGGEAGCRAPGTPRPSRQRRVFARCGNVRACCWLRVLYSCVLMSIRAELILEARRTSAQARETNPKRLYQTLERPASSGGDILFRRHTPLQFIEPVEDHSYRLTDAFIH